MIPDPGAHPQVAQQQRKRSLSMIPDPGTHPQVVQQKSVAPLSMTPDPGEHPQVVQQQSERPLSKFPDPGVHAQVVQQKTRGCFILPRDSVRGWTWTPVSLDKWGKHVVLLLYAGKDDAGSLDACLHAHHAWISPSSEPLTRGETPESWAKPDGVGTREHPVYPGGPGPGPNCIGRPEL